MNNSTWTRVLCVIHISSVKRGKKFHHKEKKRVYFSSSSLSLVSAGEANRSLGLGGAHDHSVIVRFRKLRVHRLKVKL